MSYIKCEDAEQVLTDFINKSANPVTLNDVVNLLGNIHNLPNADVRENVRGEWIEDGETYDGVIRYLCSVCTNVEWGRHPPFCPNCGADMGGEKDEQRA